MEKKKELWEKTFKEVNKVYNMSYEEQLAKEEKLIKSDSHPAIRKLYRKPYPKEKQFLKTC